MPLKTKIDYLDLKILSELQTNCRIRNCDLAQKIGLAPSTTANRVRRLENDAFILGYGAVINAVYLGAVHQMRQPSLTAADDGRRSYFETVLRNLEVADTIKRMIEEGADPINRGVNQIERGK